MEQSTSLCLYLIGEFTRTAVVRRSSRKLLDGGTTVRDSIYEFSSYEFQTVFCSTLRNVTKATVPSGRRK